MVIATRLCARERVGRSLAEISVERAPRTRRFRLVAVASPSQADVFKSCRLRKKLEGVPRSVLKSFLQSLKMDTSDD